MSSEVEDGMAVFFEEISGLKSRLIDRMKHVAELESKVALQAKMIEGYQADVLGKRLLATDEVASMLGVTPHTVCTWRGAVNGPTFITFTLGKGEQTQVRYRLSDVEAWLRDCEGPEREDSTPIAEDIPERA